MGAGTLTYSGVFARVHLIKIVYVLENWLFTADIHEFVKSHIISFSSELHTI